MSSSVRILLLGAKIVRIVTGTSVRLPWV